MRITKRHRTYGALLRAHREWLELTAFEYAVLARCNPAQARNAERDFERLPDGCDVNLQRWGMDIDGLRAAPLGKPPHHDCRLATVWTEIPYENHTTARGMSEEPHTLEEVGVVMGVTRERVRQLEIQALRTLKIRDSRGFVLRQLLVLSAESSNEGHPLVQLGTA